jgi:hypothetical protein
MNPEMLKAVAATEEASKRARWVYLIIQITCVVIFMALWHETPIAWSTSRLDTARLVSWYLDCKDKKHDELGLKASDVFSAEQMHDRCHDKNSLYSNKDIEKAQKFLEASPLTPAEARTRLRDLQRVLIERIENVSVPFLGITLDINDLSFLGGISFLFLLMWFRFSLWREQQNLEAVFERATKTSEISTVYELLAMSQVLTTPPRLDGQHVGFWANLPDALVWTPVVVQFFVVLNDWLTFALGSVLSQTTTFIDLAIGTALWGIIVAVTIQCRTIEKAVDKHWANAFKLANTAPATK